MTPVSWPWVGLVATQGCYSQVDEARVETLEQRRVTVDTFAEGEQVSRTMASTTKNHGVLPADRVHTRLFGYASPFSRFRPRMLPRSSGKAGRR